MRRSTAVTEEQGLQEFDPLVLQEAADGDADAFASLMRELQAPVWRFLRHMLNDPEMADEVAQETFIRVYRRLGSFRGTSKFSTWVFSIAKNTAIDAVRKRDRRLRLVQSVVGERRISVPAAAPLRTELDAALATLSIDQRQAFLLVEVVGMTYRDAGTSLGVPEGTVKSRVYTARQGLRRWMEAAEEAAGD